MLDSNLAIDLTDQAQYEKGFLLLLLPLSLLLLLLLLLLFYFHFILR